MTNTEFELQSPVSLTTQADENSALAIALTPQSLLTEQAVLGTDQDDTLTGQDGDDVLIGLLGNDTLDGGGGDDVLIGDETGANLLTNGDFSSGIDGWTANNPTGGEAPDNKFARGFVSFNSGNETTFGDSIEQSFATLGRTPLLVSLDLFEDNGPVASHDFRIEILDDNGTVIATEDATVADNSRITVSFAFVPTSDQTTIRITNTGASTSINTDGKLDNVSVVELVSPNVTGGDDLLLGGTGNDTIFGGAGNDSIVDGEGDDVIYGGDGNDIIDADNSFALFEDTIFAGAGDDIVFTGIGNQFAPNAYFGGEGIDTYDLDGLLQSSLVHFDLNAGGIIIGESGVVEQQIVGFENFNSADAAGDERVTGTTGDNVLSTGNGDNSISGLAGNDTIDGGAGDDSIDGGGGNDLLIGGPGRNTIDGGTGDDTARFDGDLAEFLFVLSGDALTVADTSDFGNLTRLTNVETLSFDDADVDIGDLPTVSGLPITVTTALDVVNNNDGVTSLREAILLGQQASVPITITFDQSLAGETLVLTSGDLNITDGVEITGLTTPDGAQAITISGNDNSRIFDVSGGGDLTVDSLALIDGNSGDEEGGAIRGVGSIRVTVRNSSISSSETTDRGGAISLSSGVLEVSGSSFIGNTAGARGGAISYAGNTVSVSTSTFTGNSAGDDGGAIATNTVNQAGSGTISDSTFTGNQATDKGGAIFNVDGRLELSGLLVTGNTGGAGGGVASFGDNRTATPVENSVIVGNTAVVRGDDVATNRFSDPDFITGGGNFIGDGQDFNQGAPVDHFVDGVNGDIVGTTANPLGVVLGDDQDNTLSGGADTDFVDGGLGVDTLSFAALDAPGFVFGTIEFGVIADLSAQGAPQNTGQGTDLFLNIENLEGSQFGDLLTGDEAANTLSGGAGGDVLNGGGGDDLLEGGEGIDAIEGGAGADQLFGGTGGGPVEGDIATYFSATGPLVFDFGATTSEIQAGSSAEVLEDTIGTDIEGVAGAGAHSNTFLGDELTGLTFFLGGAAADTFVGGSGVDQLIGLGGNDVMYGNDGGDALIGEGGNDDLFGGAGADVFFFDGINEGDDTIHDLELGLDLILFTGGNVTRVRLEDTDAGGTAATDTLLTYEVGGVDAGTITIIDHDATTVEALANIVGAPEIDLL